MSGLLPAIQLKRPVIQIRSTLRHSAKVYFGEKSTPGCRRHRCIRRTADSSPKEQVRNDKGSRGGVGPTSQNQQQRRQKRKADSLRRCSGQALTPKCGFGMTTEVALRGCLTLKFDAVGTLALIRRFIRHGDVAAAGAQKPAAFGPSNHGFEITSLSAVRTSDGVGHGRKL
jgi:hypothetical protein